jgi:hypothetical protein
MKLPHLSPTAKGQLWGLLVGGSTAFYVTSKLNLSLGLFAIGGAAAWAAGEAWFGKRLMFASDAKALTLAVASGLAFPWIGFAFAALMEMMRN